MDYINKIGSIVARARYQKNMSMAQLSKLSHVSVETIKNLENNKCKNISFKKVEQLANALDLTIEAFLNNINSLPDTSLDTIKMIDYAIINEDIELTNKNNTICFTIVNPQINSYYLYLNQVKKSYKHIDERVLKVINKLNK